MDQNNIPDRPEYKIEIKEGPSIEKRIKKDLRSINDVTKDDVFEIFDVAHELKKLLKKGVFERQLENKVLAMIFEKPSLRTRFTFEVGMYQLGGHAIYLAPNDIGLGKRETIHDTAKNLERWADMIMIRTFEQKNVDELAKYANIPVINGLSDLEHPCQALTDLFTLEEKFGNVEGLNMTFIGDGNNICHSLMLLCAKMGVNLTIGVPKGCEPMEEYIKGAQKLCKMNNCTLKIVNDPVEAVKEAFVVYTDVWTSMGQEDKAEERKKKFESFQVNKELIGAAPPNVLVMHDLPAHRGEEITDEVMDAPYSIIFDQAENRLHAQKGIMVFLNREIVRKVIDFTLV